VQRQFSYRKVDLSSVAGPYLAGGRNGCPKGPFRTPGLYAFLDSPNRKLFDEVQIGVFEIEEKGDGEAYLKRALASHPEGLPEYSCVDAGNAPFSFMQSGRFWIEVMGHCPAGDIYKYEVGEVLEMLRQKDPAGVPGTFAYASCGQGKPDMVSTESFLAGLKKKETFWGRPFPAAREEAKKALAH
jgi:hypothetical protein